MAGQAQLVADGQTNVLNGVATNITGGITVGTNGSFTLLIVTNGATVTNSSGNAIVGSNASASTNRVVVTDPSSLWQSAGNFYVGEGGSANELDILNGGLVLDVSGSVGQYSATSNNLVLVSGAGSIWTNTGGVNVGNGSSGNTLIVTNGGKVYSGSSSVGANALGLPSNNIVVITGPGSSWSNSALYLGNMDNGHDQLLINNGGSLVCSGTVYVGQYCKSNILTVADAGSLLQCLTFTIGYSGTANQCIVSNGATLAVSSLNQASMIGGTSTAITVTGAGTVWTNAGNFDFGQNSNVLSITGGGMVVNNNGYIDNQGGRSNTVIVAGTNSLWKNLGDLHAVDVGAQLIITNGGMVANNYGYFGYGADSYNCTALVSGNGSIWTNRYDLYIGDNNSASNQLVVANSGTVFAQNLYLGAGVGGNARFQQHCGGEWRQPHRHQFRLCTINDLVGTLTLNSGLITCTTL